MFDDVDALGRYSDSKAERLLHGVRVAQVAELQWSPDVVKARLSAAAILFERIERRPGPSQKITAWIDYRLHANLSMFDKNAIAEGVRLKTRAPDRTRYVPEPKEMSDAEAAIEWPQRYLSAHEAELKTLQMFLFCEARNAPWSRFCLGVATSRGQANRRLDRALRLICAGLLRDGVQP